MSPWLVTNKFDPRGAALADRHYSRRTVGSSQFLPPGETLVLVTEDGLAVWGWWRPHPSSGIRAMNGLDGWTCAIFRNESATLSSDLVLAAESALLAHKGRCGPDGMLTYVWDKKVRSTNPGACYKVAGWRRHPVKPRSADRRKTLLFKPFALAGRAERLTLEDIQAALRASWSAGTSLSPHLWTSDRPSIGQCAVSALIVQDYFGGSLLRATLADGSHYWNRMPGGEHIDYTRDQFDVFQPLETSERDRAYLLSNEVTRSRYEDLRQRVARALMTLKMPQVECGRAREIGALL